MLKGSQAMGRVDHILSGDQAGADLERLAERQRTGREQVRQVAIMTAVVSRSTTSPSTITRTWNASRRNMAPTPLMK